MASSSPLCFLEQIIKPIQKAHRAAPPVSLLCIKELCACVQVSKKVWRSPVRYAEVANSSRSQLQVVVDDPHLTVSRKHPSTFSVRKLSYPDEPFCAACRNGLHQAAAEDGRCVRILQRMWLVSPLVLGRCSVEPLIDAETFE